jgi:hypothetical protein
MGRACLRSCDLAGLFQGWHRKHLCGGGRGGRHRHRVVIHLQHSTGVTPACPGLRVADRLVRTVVADRLVRTVWRFTRCVLTCCSGVPVARCMQYEAALERHRSAARFALHGPRRGSSNWKSLAILGCARLGTTTVGRRGVCRKDSGTNASSYLPELWVRHVYGRRCMCMDFVPFPSVNNEFMSAFVHFDVYKRRYVMTPRSAQRIMMRMQCSPRVWEGDSGIFGR